MEEYDILDKFFGYREEDFLSEIQTDIEALKHRIKGIKREEITDLISSISKDNDTLKQELIKKIDNLLVDYNIMLAYYNKKYYKKGFEDALEIERKCKIIKK